MPKRPPRTNSTHEPAPPPRRPRFQFTIFGLMVIMMGVGMAAAPAYYLLSGMQGEQNAHLIGMIAVLAGPLLLMTAVSLLLALLGWVYRR